jgi:fatty-acyl-CoA synthase
VRSNGDNLNDLLRRSAERWPDNELLVFPDERRTYAAMLTAANEHARSLIALGVRPRDHVGILMPNSPEYIELLFGICLAGGVAVPVNARYKAPELRYVIDDADLVGIVCSDRISEYANFAGLLAEALPGLTSAPSPERLDLAVAPRLRFAAQFGRQVDEFLLSEAGFRARAAAAAPASAAAEFPVDGAAAGGATALLMYTSGTTANPKGCPLSHSALVRNGANMNRERYRLTPDDRFWAPLPMFHMASILPLLACMDAGATLLSMLRVEAGAALDMLERECATIAFPAFPTVTNDLISHPSFSRRDLSRLRRINNVAPPDVLRRFQAAFPRAVQTGAYGLTEATGVIAFNDPDEDLETRLHTCGRPFAGIEVKIIDPVSLENLPAGERGEIWIRGYAVFSGYHKAPEKNAECFHDGWFRTGDLCSVDASGQISFHGRIKDMLKVGGENVAAIEIESLLATHPAVKLAQVIGVPDERLLEVPAAFVELNEGAMASADELIDYCKSRVASFKVPRSVHFVSEWPMSATKVQKHRLRDLLD